jgi:hypothetical protein
LLAYINDFMFRGTQKLFLLHLTMVEDNFYILAIKTFATFATKNYKSAPRIKT